MLNRHEPLRCSFGPDGVRLRNRHDMDNSIEEVLFSFYGVQIRIIDPAGTDICRRLREALPAEVAAPSQPGSTLVSYIVTAGIFQGAAEQTAFRIARDGTCFYT